MIALRAEQLWAEDADGHILRAWRPALDGVRHGARIRAYCGEVSEIDGWHDPASGQAVNQRGYDGRTRATASALICDGGCGLQWHAPAATTVVAEGHGCLECGGRLTEA